jgi:hypothetical protein
MPEQRIVHVVVAIDTAGREIRHIFSTAQLAQDWAAGDPRQHLIHDYVVDSQVQQPPPPSLVLPEDEPLPQAAKTLEATPQTFDSVYAGAGPGDHIVLTAGAYGSKALNQSFPADRRLVIRAQRLLGATFSRLEVGSGHIVSGVTVDRGHNSETGAALWIKGSDVRFTRGKALNGAQCVKIGPGASSILVDHCDVSRSRELMWWLDYPKDQRRITVARCWVHELLPGGSNNYSMGFAWNGENVYRETPHDITVRLNYVGPGVASKPEVINDVLHHKGSQSIYAFNRFDVPDRHLLCHRFGLRARHIGNYAPTAILRMWDDRGWFYGNIYATMQGPAGRSAYYDDVKNLAGQPNNSVGGFHAHKRSRLAGNDASLSLGDTFDSNWCFGTQPDPATLPDPIAAGCSLPRREFKGVVYAADPVDDPDRGIRIRAQTGPITLAAAPPAGCAITSWVDNLDAVPGDAAPAAWLADLLAEYPWVAGICPNPTSVTGGPNGSAPWSIAEGLTRGDAKDPNTGPHRDSPGGLFRA